MTARLVIVFVVDGLRPDAITAADTPTLHRLRAEGVWYANSHAVFPTVTRVNAATLATGVAARHARHRGQSDLHPGCGCGAAIDTSAYRRLLEVDRATGGNLVLTEDARGAAGDAGHAPRRGQLRLHGQRAPHQSAGPAGVGVLVNGYFDPGKRVRGRTRRARRFSPGSGGSSRATGTERYDAAVTWTQRVLREYVLPEIAPAVVINWLTEPDHTQHMPGRGVAGGAGGARHADRELAQVLDALDGLGLAASTDVFVVSDHGFTSNTGGVDVARELR